MTNFINHNNSGSHVRRGHQWQSTSGVAPLGFQGRTANNAQFQVQTSQEEIKEQAIAKFATFNVQGLLSKTKQMLLADDFLAYNLNALMIQETHLKGQGVLELKSSTGKQVRLYYSGNEKNSSNGVGIIVPPETNCNFLPISDRLIMLTILDQKIKINLISAYAPTSDRTSKNPEDTVKFYENLSSVIKKTKCKETLIIGGDFNSKTKLSEIPPRLSKVIGSHAKSHINKNGEMLLEFAEMHDLKITNTFFKHKPAHSTTWKCPEKRGQVTDSRTRTTRKNPYRNQIDYILTKNSANIQILDSRSYGGFTCNSDHKPVISKIKIAWKYTKPKTNKTEKQINSQAINKTKETRIQYQTLITEKLKTTNPSTVQQKWNNVVNITKEAAIEVAGYKQRKKTSKRQNQEITRLSKQQKSIHQQIKTTQSKTTIKQLKKDRNKILGKIHQILENEENMAVQSCLKPIEEMPDEPIKTYAAVKQMKKMKPRKPLLVKTENGLTANEQVQANLIANYFHKVFYKNAEPIPTLQPRKMKNPFTAGEIENAAKRLKNNTSPGIDNITSEMIKYAPKEIFQEIANIFNLIAETGEYPIELSQGIITPLQKPGKKRGPITNLRPITLLSVIRKLLAICLCERTNKLLDQKIPQNQAAYRPGRSTTEHVFAVKMIIERTLASAEEEIHLLMLDMSKAFDTIQRKTLFEDLETTVEPDELLLFTKLLHINLAVRCGNSTSSFFETDTGGPQGECSSAKNFTFYLANTLEEFEQGEVTTQPQLETFLSMELLYADDISKISNDISEIERTHDKYPEILEKRGLQINEDKTEKYTISRTNTDQTWKKCKLLGTLLDTTEDIKRRKSLAIEATKSVQSAFKNKKLWIGTKANIFDTYVSSVFLYNACTWTITQSQEQQIDSFQRKLIRINVLNIKWPKIIKNEEVYRKTKIRPWSQRIRKQKMTWLGHVLRMSPDIPARKALEYAQKPYKIPRGRPKLTWIKSIKIQLQEEMGLTWQEASAIAQDRKAWRALVQKKYF